MAQPVESTMRAKVGRRALILFNFALAVYSPVSYLHYDSTTHKAFALISGACFLWWGVTGVIRTTREDDDPTATRDDTPEKSTACRT